MKLTWKNFVRFMDKVMRMNEPVKSGLRNFIAGDFALSGRLDVLSLIEI